MAWDMSASIRPRSRLAWAQAALTNPSARMKLRENRKPADREVVDSALRLRRVQGLGRDVHLAEGVFFDAVVAHGGDSFCDVWPRMECFVRKRDYVR